MNKGQLFRGGCRHIGQALRVLLLAVGEPKTCARAINPLTWGARLLMAGIEIGPLHFNTC